jgi:NADH:ubiquinone oxidoreductase subunit
MDQFGALAYISGMTTLGTRLYTMFRGRLVGKDADGRSYYQERRSSRRDGRPIRRWVIYRPGEDPSAVPAEWWNWLHYADDEPLPPSVRKSWQLPFEPNRTGDPAAYRPPGSEYRGGHRGAANSDYEAWSPDN